jgi:hypothetical protein
MSYEAKTSEDEKLLAEINAPPPPAASDSNGMTAAIKISSVSMKLVNANAKVRLCLPFTICLC